MLAPMVTFANSTEVEVRWDPKTFHHGGPIKRYELKVIGQRTGYEKHFNDISGESTKMTISLDKISDDLVPDCANNTITNLYNFTMMAVTYDENQEYLGPWSQVEVVPAYCRGNTTV